MFGYVRIAKPDLKIYEYEQYRSLYCGSCDLLGEYGYFTRFALSYDMAFLLALELSVNNYPYTTKPSRCPFNPLKKINLIVPSQKVLTTDIILMLTKYKLMDTSEDSKFLKVPAKLALSLLNKVYKTEQADSRMLNLGETCSSAMLAQAQLESARESSIDAICEPTAQLMQNIFSVLYAQDENPALQRLGYLLGRYVYICDAIDDLFDDEKHGQYNVLLMQGLSPVKAIEFARGSLMATIAEAQLALELIDLYGDFVPIVKNIIELGLIFTANGLIQTQLKKYGTAIEPN